MKRYIYIHLSVIEFKSVVSAQIRLDGIEVEQYVVVLALKEQRRCHTLPAGNCVAFTGTGSDECQILQRHFQVFLLMN